MFFLRFAVLFCWHWNRMLCSRVHGQCVTDHVAWSTWHNVFEKGKPLWVTYWVTMSSFVNLQSGSSEALTSCAYCLGKEEVVVWNFYFAFFMPVYLIRLCNSTIAMRLDLQMSSAGAGPQFFGIPTQHPPPTRCTKYTEDTLDRFYSLNVYFFDLRNIWTTKTFPQSNLPRHSSCKLASIRQDNKISMIYSSTLKNPVAFKRSSIPI